MPSDTQSINGIKLMNFPASDGEVQSRVVDSSEEGSRSVICDLFVHLARTSRALTPYLE
jgi:hypothetical protein